MSWQNYTKTYMVQNMHTQATIGFLFGVKKVPNKWWLFIHFTMLYVSLCVWWKRALYYFVWFTTNNRGHDCMYFIRCCHSWRFIRACWKNQTHINGTHVCIVYKWWIKNMHRFFLHIIVVTFFRFVPDSDSFHCRIESHKFIIQIKINIEPREISTSFEYRCNFVVV